MCSTEGCDLPLADACDDGERRAFNVRHGLSDHRPLGGSNRVRRHAYIGSANFRHANFDVVMNLAFKMSKHLGRFDDEHGPALALGLLAR